MTNKEEKKKKDVKDINEINYEKSLTLISKMLTLLSKQADELDKKIRDIEKVAVRVRKNLNDFDALTSKCNFMNRYGFDGDEMFYIGVASGRVYRRPINKKIVEKIEHSKEMDWKEIGEIGDYFLYGKIAEEEEVAEEEAEEETEEVEVETETKTETEENSRWTPAPEE
jgi:hypothetical protein